MINITKTDVILSYLGYFIKFFSNILVLPFILYHLSRTEYGLWAIFLSIGTLTILLDLGFGAVITRYTTYAYCGAKELPKEGLPDISQKNEPNYELLFSVILSAKKIYKKMSFLAIIALSLGTFYILFIVKDNANQNSYDVLLAWILYSTGLWASIHFMYYTCVYKGLGKVKELQIMVIINQLVYIFLQITFLYLGFGLVALAASHLIVSILLRFQLSSRIKKMIVANSVSYKKAKKEIKNNYQTVYNSLSHNSKGIGYVLVSNYLQNQGIILLCSIFLSLEFVGSYSLTMQLIGIVGALPAITFNTYLTKMSSLQLASKIEELKNTYSVVSVLSFLLFSIGGIFLILFGEWGLEIIESNTPMLPIDQTILLLLYSFILTNHQRSTNFISLSNRQPYIKAYIISSIVSFLLSLIMIYKGAGLWGIIIPNLIVQLVYNGWKWPYEAFKITKLNFFELFSRSFFLLVEYTFRRR